MGGGAPPPAPHRHLPPPGEKGRRDLMMRRCTAAPSGADAYIGISENPVEGAGDIWTWTAICADCKLVPSWLVGARDAEYASAFMHDLKQRLRYRVQLTSDGHRVYLEAVESAFDAEVDYAMLIKLYGTPPEAEIRIKSEIQNESLPGDGGH
jgi:hypothetical protein